MTTDIARLRELAETLRREADASEELHPQDSEIAVMREAADAIPALFAELETTRAQVAGMRTALEGMLAIRNGDIAEAAERVRIEKEARQALSPTPAEKA